MKVQHLVGTAPLIRWIRGLFSVSFTLGKAGEHPYIRVRVLVSLLEAYSVCDVRF